MDRIALTSLKRPVLQQLAKREGVKANGRNAEIIDLLMEKYPDGVPRRSPPEEDDRSAQRASLKRIKPDEDTEAIDPLGEPVNKKQKSSKLRRGRTRSSKRKNAVADKENNAPAQSDAHQWPMVPGNKDVRRTKRAMTRLVNEDLLLNESMEELEALLETAHSLYESSADVAKDVMWNRHFMEVYILQRMRLDRTLWDGTRLMEEQEEKEGKVSGETNDDKVDGED